MSELEPRHYSMFVGGAWRPARGGGEYQRTSPSTGEIVTTIAWGDAEDVDAAVVAARAAFDSGVWSEAPASRRAAVLNKAAQRLREKAPLLAQLLTSEMGKPIATSDLEVELTADALESFAALALGVRGESFTHESSAALGLTISEPVGVVGVITPWNFPLLLLGWKVGAALAAGCTLVAKPSELASATAFELARVLEDAGLPPGVFHVVTGPGEVVGDALVRHAGVDKVSFTGSTNVGKQVMRAASDTVKRVSLELGGKSPNIVFADADFGAAIGGVIGGIFMNAGQVCMAGSRLLVHESIAEPFLGALAQATRGLPVGDPFRRDVIYGPLVSEAQLSRVLGLIEDGKNSGATLVTGGHRLTGAGYDDGYYVAPTIFTKVAPTSRIAREEIFGPVLTVMTFRDTAEALRLANDTCYGLAAAVWTQHLDTAISMAKGIKAGTVWVNAYHATGMGNAMPFGGFKQSGIGRELGRVGLSEYLETKSVQIKLGSAPAARRGES